MESCFHPNTSGDVPTKIITFMKTLRNVKEKLEKLDLSRKRKNTLKKIAQYISERGIGNCRLDLGCGIIKRPGFLGIDINSQADIQWDLRAGIPFPDCSVAEIRSDHFFEHLNLPFVVTTFKECNRVLIPGGIFDFTVPHFDAYLDAYLRKDFEFLKKHIYDIPNGQEDYYNTCFDRISWLLLRGGEHTSLFDKQSLFAKLELAGFSRVSTREHDDKRDINRRFSSIYMEAIK